jgi:hypothetical protein
MDQRVPASDVSPSYEFSNMIATILERNSFVFAAICLHAIFPPVTTIVLGDYYPVCCLLCVQCRRSAILAALVRWLLSYLLTAVICFKGVHCSSSVKLLRETDGLWKTLVATSLCNET